MPYLVLYGGLCNLCVTGIQLLENWIADNSFAMPTSRYLYPGPMGDPTDNKFAVLLPGGELASPA